VPQATFNYIAGLEWIRAKENLCLVGPAGTGKSHLLVGVGHAAVQAGLRVRYFTTSGWVERREAELIEDDQVDPEQVVDDPTDRVVGQSTTTYRVNSRITKIAVRMPTNADHNTSAADERSSARSRAFSRLNPTS